MEKTCGNCALRKVYNPSPEVPCVGWTESAESALQRYAQLEQVAREMLTEYGDAAHALCVLNPGRSNGKTLLAKLSYEMSIDHRKFRDQLEELGVSVDD